MSWRVVLPTAIMCLLAISNASAQLPTVIVERNLAEIEHPNPRGGLSSESVLSVSELPPRASTDERLVYSLAAVIPEVFDGIYSYCHVGRSLLSCFEGHEALYDTFTQQVAKQVYILHRQGLDLAAIRQHLRLVPL